MSEFKVGLMAMATMMAVVYMSLKVTSNQSGFGEYVMYRTIVSDASGIFPKTPIKVAGINAGRIKKIELQGNKALITFEVLERIIISENSKLRIKTVGFLGDKYLEIHIGDSEKRLGGDEFITSEEGGGMETLVRDASEVLKDVKVVVKSIKGSIAPYGKVAPMTEILSGVKEVLANTKEVTRSLKEVISGNQDKLNSIVENLQKFSEDLKYNMDKDQKDSAMADVKKILGNVDELTTDLKLLVSDIAAGKGTMGQLLVDEEIADEVKATLAGVKKIVTKVEAIRTELTLFTGANSDHGAVTDASLKIFPSPERFYLLGITTSDIGPDSEKDRITTINGVSTTTNEVVRTRDTYRFNVQIGRKIHNWSFRAGLIESSGGFGVDYDLVSRGLRFSTEIFDYREDIGPNWRISTEVQLWNVFYGKASFEDILEDSRSGTLQAGLRFNDEDLKGLIAFFF